MTMIIRRDIGAVAHLTLNQPEKLNALSDAMLDALQDTLDALAGDSAVRVVVIAGAGKAFCAGHDLKEMSAARSHADGGAAYFADLFKRCARLMTTIVRQPQPVIAQAHGIATAAGCQLVASCDMAVAAEGTRFGVNGVNIGLFCSTPMVALSRNVARKQAFELLTTGAFITTDKAVDIGLINRAVAPEVLEDEALALAKTLADKLDSALKLGKRAFYDQIEMSLDDAYAYAGQVMTHNMMDADTAEGINAFLEKRSPRWSQE